MTWLLATAKIAPTCSAITTPLATPFLSATVTFPILLLSSFIISNQIIFYSGYDGVV